MAQGGKAPGQVDAPEQVPGLTRLLLWLLFRPVDLHYRLRAAGIRLPGGRLGQLWREQAEGGRAAGVYVKRLLLVLVVGSPLATLVMALGLFLAGIPLQRGWGLSAVLCSAAGLLLALVSGLAAGVLLGSLASLSVVVGLHATGGGAFGPLLSGTAAVAVGSCLGLAGGSKTPYIYA